MERGRGKERKKMRKGIREGSRGEEKEIRNGIRKRRNCEGLEEWNKLINKDMGEWEMRPRRRNTMRGWNS